MLNRTWHCGELLVFPVSSLRIVWYLHDLRQMVKCRRYLSLGVQRFFGLCFFPTFVLLHFSLVGNCCP